jgi:hypothetical protein
MYTRTFKMGCVEADRSILGERGGEVNGGEKKRTGKAREEKEMGTEKGPGRRIARGGEGGGVPGVYGTINCDRGDNDDEQYLPHKFLRGSITGVQFSGTTAHGFLHDAEQARRDHHRDRSLRFVYVDW